jgi:hypothetical protein
MLIIKLLFPLLPARSLLHYLSWVFMLLVGVLSVLSFYNAYVVVDALIKSFVKTQWADYLVFGLLCLHEIVKLIFFNAAFVIAALLMLLAFDKNIRRHLLGRFVAIFLVVSCFTGGLYWLSYLSSVVGGVHRTALLIEKDRKPIEMESNRRTIYVEKLIDEDLKQLGAQNERIADLRATANQRVAWKGSNTPQENAQIRAAQQTIALLQQSLKRNQELLQKEHEKIQVQNQEKSFSYQTQLQEAKQESEQKIRGFELLQLLILLFGALIDYARFKSFAYQLLMEQTQEESKYKVAAYKAIKQSEWHWQQAMEEISLYQVEESLLQDRQIVRASPLSKTVQYCKNAVQRMRGTDKTDKADKTDSKYDFSICHADLYGHYQKLPQQLSLRAIARKHHLPHQRLSEYYKGTFLDLVIQGKYVPESSQEWVLTEDKYAQMGSMSWENQLIHN